MPNYQLQTDNPVADYTKKLGDADSYMYSVQHAKDLHLDSLPAQAEPEISFNVNEFGIPEDMSLSTPNITEDSLQGIEEEKPLFERAFNAAPEIVQQLVTPIITPFFNNPIVSGVTIGLADGFNGTMNLLRDVNNAMHPDNQFTEDEWLQIPELLERDANSPTEGIISGLTQFVGVYSGLGKLRNLDDTAGAGKKLIDDMLRGGLADAAFDPEDGNLSTFLNSLDDDEEMMGVPVGQFKGPLTAYLGEPIANDAEAFERLQFRAKSLIEGAGLGLGTNAVMKMTAMTMTAMKGMKEYMLETDPETFYKVLGQSTAGTAATIASQESKAEDAVSFIKEFEGYKASGYYATKSEQANGLVTVGYGSTGRVKKGEKITKEQAEEYLQEDIAVAEKAVNSLVKVNLTPNQKAAVVSLVFNVGQGNFKKSKALKALNKGDMETFMKEAFDSKVGFVKSGGKVLKGLVKRRKAEKELFMRGTA
tara:strand:- start:4102 stop:5532 length:1431 start_codon:yes stop_codon:yes gene_type:complete